MSVYMLAEHPQVEQRLREEIFEKVGQSGNPTYAHMCDMKYMRAFLNGVYTVVESTTTKRSVDRGSPTLSPCVSVYFLDNLSGTYILR